MVGLLDAFARLDEGSDLLNRVEDLGGLVGLPGDLREDRGLAAVLQLHRELGPPLELPDCPVPAIRGFICRPHRCFPGL